MEFFSLYLLIIYALIGNTHCSSCSRKLHTVLLLPLLLFLSPLARPFVGPPNWIQAIPFIFSGLCLEESLLFFLRDLPVTWSVIAAMEQSLSLLPTDVNALKQRRGVTCAQ